MKIIEILPPPQPTKLSVRNYLSDTGKAFTTYDNGAEPIDFSGIKLYEKAVSEGGLGYGMIKIRKKGYMVHRLVAETFLPNPDHKPVVNHKDLNRKNNDVSNLEWVTYSENSYHAASGGVSYKARKRWCMACDRSPVVVWCIEELPDKQIRWRKHRNIVFVEA